LGAFCRTTFTAERSEDKSSKLRVTPLPNLRPRDVEKAVDDGFFAVALFTAFFGGVVFSVFVFAVAVFLPATVLPAAVLASLRLAFDRFSSGFFALVATSSSVEGLVQVALLSEGSLSSKAVTEVADLSTVEGVAVAAFFVVDSPSFGSRVMLARSPPQNKSAPFSRPRLTKSLPSSANSEQAASRYRGASPVGALLAAAARARTSATVSVGDALTRLVSPLGSRKRKIKLPPPGSGLPPTVPANCVNNAKHVEKT
jgi:hypothetical protein